MKVSSIRDMILTKYLILFQRGKLLSRITFNFFEYPQIHFHHIPKLLRISATSLLIAGFGAGAGFGFWTSSGVGNGAGGATGTGFGAGGAGLGAGGASILTATTGLGYGFGISVFWERAGTPLFLLASALASTTIFIASSISLSQIAF